MSPKKRHDVVAEIQPQYDFSGAVRGKYYERYRQGVTVHLINDRTADLALIFDDGEPVDAALLGDLLFLLRGAYAAGVQSAVNVRSKAHSSIDIGRHLRAYLRRLTINDIDRLFTANLGSASLITRSISYQSPLRMLLSGSSDGLQAAVVLAGGVLRDSRSLDPEVNLGPVRQVADMLREALVRGVGVPLGYGVRSRRLKLSKAELRELLRHDPATEKRGGFQRFLIGLQSRVNRVSGEIDLSESEMATILKHGRNPSRGGWQGSIRKIFGNHFDFEAA